MKVLLKIGHATFLLPNESGIQTVMKVMSQAIRCSDNTYFVEPNKRHIYCDDPSPMEVSMKYLPAKTRIVIGEEVLCLEERT